jgi:hypothetical protein
MKSQAYRNKVEQEGFLEIQIRASVLARLLTQHKLCAEDLHCQNRQDKNLLLKLLLQSVRL